MRGPQICLARKSVVGRRRRSSEVALLSFVVCRPSSVAVVVAVVSSASTPTSSSSSSPSAVVGERPASSVSCSPASGPAGLDLWAACEAAVAKSPQRVVAAASRRPQPRPEAGAVAQPPAAGATAPSAFSAGAQCSVGAGLPTGGAPAGGGGHFAAQPPLFSAPVRSAGALGSAAVRLEGLALGAPLGASLGAPLGASPAAACPFRPPSPQAGQRAETPAAGAAGLASCAQLADGAGGAAPLHTGCGGPFAPRPSPAIAASQGVVAACVGRAESAPHGVALGAPLGAAPGASPGVWPSAPPDAASPSSRALATSLDAWGAPHASVGAVADGTSAEATGAAPAGTWSGAANAWETPADPASADPAHGVGDVARVSALEASTAADTAQGAVASSDADPWGAPAAHAWSVATTGAGGTAVAGGDCAVAGGAPSDAAWGAGGGTPAGAAWGAPGRSAPGVLHGAADAWGASCGGALGLPAVGGAGASGVGGGALIDSGVHATCGARAAAGAWTAAGVFAAFGSAAAGGTAPEIGPAVQPTAWTEPRPHLHHSPAGAGAADSEDDLPLADLAPLKASRGGVCGDARVPGECGGGGGRGRAPGLCVSSRLGACSGGQGQELR